MRLVLDANEYIFALGLFRKESCEALLKFIIDTFPLNSFCICRTIVEEVKANLTLQEFHNFIKLINVFSTIDDDFFIPFELGAKYEAKGLKPADALIAAYTDMSPILLASCPASPEPLVASNVLSLRLTVPKTLPKDSSMRLN